MIIKTLDTGVTFVYKVYVDGKLRSSVKTKKEAEKIAQDLQKEGFYVEITKE